MEFLVTTAGLAKRVVNIVGKIFHLCGGYSTATGGMQDDSAIRNLLCPALLLLALSFTGARTLRGRVYDSRAMMQSLTLHLA